MKILNSSLFLIAILFIFSCSERIDAGHVGVKVNLHGTEKGVDDVVEVTGRVWYTPWNTSVYEVPTYVRDVSYTLDEHEGFENNEEFRITTKDGLTVAFDVGLNYRTEAHNVVKIFKKYRKTPDELERGILRKYVRDGFNSIAALYNAEELYEKRNEFKERSEQFIKDMLEPEGFTIENITILNEIRPPESIKENIERKINAKQIALEKQEQLAQAEADAAKKVATARGDSLSLVIKAQAESEAYRLKKKELTPILVKQQWIEKWNGQLPTYSGGSSQSGITLFKEIK